MKSARIAVPVVIATAIFSFPHAQGVAAKTDVVPTGPLEPHVTSATQASPAQNETSATRGNDRAAELAKKVREALAPSRPSLRDVEIVTTAPGGMQRRWLGREATKQVGGKTSLVLVLWAPESVRGFAVLSQEGADLRHQTWAYIPPVGRVRELVYAGTAQPFLGTDLTYADVGLFDLDQTDTYMLNATLNGRSVYEIVGKPYDDGAYSRIITFVTTDGFPVRREYYDVAGALWRVATYAIPEDVDGVRTIPSMQVADVQDGYSTELRFSRIRFDVDVADDLFRPERLAAIATDSQLEGALSDEGAGGEAEATARENGRRPGTETETRR